MAITRMSDAQAQFLACIWTTGQNFRSSDCDNSTAQSVIRRGWMEPTGKTGNYGNFQRTPWTEYRASTAGLIAVAAYLTKKFA